MVNTARVKRLLTLGCWNSLIRRHDQDSRILAANNRFIGAIYLKGYAVECLLKRIITSRYCNLGRLPVDVQEKLDRCFSGVSGHNLAILFDMAFSDKDPRKTRMRIPIMQFAFHWSVDLRYSTKSLGSRESAAILRLGDRILNLVSMEAQ